VRNLLSSLVVLALLAGLFQVGGAGSTPTSQLVPVPVGPDWAQATLVSDFEEAVTPSTVPPPRPLPPGCRIPLPGAACPVVAVAGGLDVPVTVYDLVPDEVTSVEDWRPLVSAFFEPEDVRRALAVIRCESRGDPTAANPRSSARGLFQILARYWPARSAKAGWEGADILDPVANTAVAAWLVYEGGGWAHWNPSRGCWGRTR